MIKWMRILMMAFVVMAAATPMVMAEEAQPEPTADAAQFPALLFGKAVGVGMVILGASWGIGKIGSTAVESMARQPEVAGNIQTAMIIAAALIEGATFFALIVCILASV